MLVRFTSPDPYKSGWLGQPIESAQLESLNHTEVTGLRVDADGSSSDCIDASFDDLSYGLVSGGGRTLHLCRASSGTLEN